jgi:hypothetical protein
MHWNCFLFLTYLYDIIKKKTRRPISPALDVTDTKLPENQIAFNTSQPDISLRTYTGYQSLIIIDTPRHTQQEIS